MSALAIILAVAAIASGLARWLRIPSIPLFLIGGLAIQQVIQWSGQAVPEDLLFDTLSLGLAVIVFAAGVELSPHRVRHRLKPVLIIGLGQFCCIGFIMFACGSLLGFDWLTAAYLGAALAASSTLVVVRHLKTTQRMFEPFGRLVTGVLLLQDAIIVAFLVIFVRMSDGPEAVATGVLATMALAAGALICYRWIVPWVTLSLHLDDEETLLFAFLLLFVFLGASSVLGLPFIVGAFFAGFTLSAFPTNGLVRGILASFSDFFLAIFFVVLGLIVALPSPEIFVKAIVLGAVLISVTVALVAALGERCGLNARNAIRTGLLLTQTSEFSLILVLQGVAAGLLGAEVFSLVVFLTVMTMTLTPFIATDRVTNLALRLHPRSRRPLPTTTPKDHVLLVGLDYFGDHLLDSVREAGFEIVVLDDDAVRVRELCDRKIDCRQMDAIDTETLDRAGIREAKAILCAPSHPREAYGLLRHAKQHARTRPFVRVFDEDEAREVDALGGRPIIMTARTVESLLEWIQTVHPKEAKTAEIGEE